MSRLEQSSDTNHYVPHSSVENSSEAWGENKINEEQDSFSSRVQNLLLGKKGSMRRAITKGVAIGSLIGLGVGASLGALAASPSLAGSAIASIPVLKSPFIGGLSGLVWGGSTGAGTAHSTFINDSTFRRVRSLEARQAGTEMHLNSNENVDNDSDDSPVSTKTA